MNKVENTAVRAMAGGLLSLCFCAPVMAVTGSGGDYQLDNSVVDNGGGGWLNGGEYSARGSTGQNVSSETQEKGGNYSNRAGFYNPPRLTYQKGLVASLSLNSGTVALSLPANSVADREMFEIGVNRQDLNSEFLVDENTLEEANRKMAASEGEWAQFSRNDLTEAYIFDEQSLTRDPLTKTGTLTMKYRDADGDGVVDGTNPEVRVDTLDAWALDEKTKLWTLLPPAGLSEQDKTLTVSFRGPGVYSMIGALATTVEKVKAYPVPFRPNGPNAGTGAGQTGTEADGITFASMPQKGELSIYTLDGKLVRKLDIGSNLDVYWNVKWDVKNSGGSRVASGVYIWRVVSGSNSKTGKVMVIW